MKSKIILTRHGKVSKNSDGTSRDELSSKSIRDVYAKNGAEARRLIGQFEEDIYLTDCFLDHSGTKRAFGSGLATIYGGFDLPFFGTQDELITMADIYRGEGLDVNEDFRLGSRGLKLNREVFAREGEEGYLTRWIENPEETSLEGKEITPYREVIERSKGYINEKLDSILREGKKFGVIATHGGIIESFAFSLSDSPRKNLDSIGGLFDMGEFVTLHIDGNTLKCFDSRFEKGNPLRSEVKLEDLC